MEFGKNRYIRRTFLTGLILKSIRASESIVVGIAVLLLMGGNAAFAYSQGGNNSGSSQPLAFAVGSPTNPAGTVFNLGDQKYNASGGSVVLPLTSILGSPLTAATLHFSLSAEVRDLKVSGSVKFNLQGTSGGQQITVTGKYRINNTETSTPANTIRNLGSGTCGQRAANACSELPLSFIGNTIVQVTVGNAQPQLLKETVMMENPYLNPFGASIVIASSDFAIVIVTTYDTGTIVWSGTSVAGVVVGTLGSGPSSTRVTGILSLNSTEHEDLVAGTATDSGTIALSHMAPSTLNVNGTYTGSSTIPTTGEQDCSTSLGFPPFPPGQGVCTQTGFNSVGQYTMRTASNNNAIVNESGSGNNNVQETVRGHYTTTWTVPALAFSSTSIAIVTTQPNK